MSDAAASVRILPRASLSRATRTGLIVGVFCFALFSLAAWQLVRKGYVIPFNAAYWDATLNPYTIGGQWLTIALLRMVHLVPDSSPASASLVTVLTAALVQAWFARTLVRRGWTPLQAALAAGLTALHPVMLYMAISGSTLLLSTLCAGAVVLALDRVEAIGDAQSLITFGLAVAVCFAIWPNAIYFCGLALLALPIANREVRSGSSAVASFAIAGIPSLILIASFLLGASLFDVATRDVLSLWSAPAHGASANLVASSVWLNTYGGHIGPAFLVLLLTCLALTPRLIAILARLVTRKAERARPVTGVVALLGPSVAGSLMTGFWHILTPFPIVALSMASATVWTITAPLRPAERWLWIATIVVGIVVGWVTPLLWQDPDATAWRGLMLS